MMGAVNGTDSTLLESLVAQLAPIAGESPYEVYLVGGAVRDALLGVASVDLDLAIDGPVDVLATALGGEVRIHDRFETATVQVGELTYDLARTRSETYAEPGALPTVVPAPIQADLDRRDFTVNAIAVSLNGQRSGGLIAFNGALDDLQARRLRVLHPASFVDDPTRLFRLVRYSARLGFAIEDETRRLAQDAVAGGALTTVSGPRIGNELRLLAAEPDPVSAIASLSVLGLDRTLDPGFGLDDSPLASRALTLLPSGGRPDLLVLAAASRGVVADRLQALLDSWAFAADERDLIFAAATRAEKLSLRLEMAGQPSEIDAAVTRAGAGLETVALAGAIGPTAAAREWLAELRDKSLSITGEDVVSAGIAPGPAVGVALAAARAAMLDGDASDAATQLSVALAAAQ
jgi:tRNA nucleotidyltransferase (CCA-adding enzyme)